MPNKPLQPPGGYQPDSRPTSPPPPRKKPDPAIFAVSQALTILQQALEAANARNREQQSQMLLLRGQLDNALERLGRHVYGN